MRIDALTKEVMLTEAEYHELTDGPKIHGWVARDKWNNLAFFTGSKPYETVDGLWATIDGEAIELDENLLPEQFCTCEPAEVELLIRPMNNYPSTTCHNYGVGTSITDGKEHNPSFIE